MTLLFQSALPRGERQGADKRPHSWTCSFNPRSRVGSDISCATRHQMTKRFQSALPRGERQGADKRPHSWTCSFNPRSRVGSDISCATRHQMTKRFQSALPRGERLWRGPVRRHRRIVSIRAPAWGATRWIKVRGWEDVFQSALPRGERRPVGGTGVSPERSFNPRSRVGSDRSAITAGA